MPQPWLPLPPAVLRAFAAAALMCEFQRHRGSGLIRVTTCWAELGGRVAVAPEGLTRRQRGAWRAFGEEQGKAALLDCVSHIDCHMSILSRITIT